MASYCLSSLDICAIRASVLNADGSPDFGQANGTAYDLSPISLGRTAVQTTVTGVTQEDGCGRICVSIPDRTITTAETLALVNCKISFELISTLTGAEVCLDGATDVIGIQAPDPSVTQLPVEFHAWSKAYTSSGQNAAPYSYFHWVWPSVLWSIGDWSIQRGVLQVSLTGTATGNANLGTGAFADLACPVDQFFGVFLADDIPDPADAPYSENADGCGWINTPVS
jgi:hypothetical protein